MKYDIFISYSRHDIEQVKQIKEEIENTADFSCWMDMDGIESGDQFEDIIISAIDNSQIVLLMLSESSMQSKWAKDEVRYAYSTKKKVVPIHIDSSELTGWFLFKFSGMDVINYYDDNQKEKFFENLLKWTGKTLNLNNKPEFTCDKIEFSQDVGKAKITNSFKFGTNEEYKYKKKLIWIVCSAVIVIALIFSISLAFMNSYFQLFPNEASESSNASFSDGILTINGVKYEMVEVEAGAFTMGATPERQNTGEAEKPSHQVTLTNNYYIGKTEVTQVLWKAVMGTNTSNFKGNNKPVECVSWDDCYTFISKLNAITGRSFRFPSEAEWEFAARGGNNSKHRQYCGSNNLDDVAWYANNSGSTTNDVATKEPNELGLFDMSGNVWEWCSDWYGPYSSSAQTNPAGPNKGSRRVICGGSWIDNDIGCLTSCRYGIAPGSGGNFIGFRLALSKQ